MIIIKLFKLFLTHPRIFLVKSARHLLAFLPDETYLKLFYRLIMHKKLELENPQTFTEKIQWLKLYDRNPLYTKMVCKNDVKEYVKDIIGADYIIPTLGIWNDVDDIDFDTLPKEFVLKCTHDSGGLLICKDKSKLDIHTAKKKLRKCLRTNYYLTSKEWPYKNVKRRIIAEKYMVDESGYELKDYKFFCFDGEVKALFIATDRGVEGEETKFDFFDAEFNHLPFTNGHPNAVDPPKKPENFDEMKEIASKLSIGIPQVRVDLYNINGKIYFGEMTFSHWGGFVPFEPEEWDYIFGSWIKLPKYNENNIFNK